MRIVFDLDGTLIDSVRDLAASARQLVASLGGRTLSDDEVAHMVGDGARVLVRRALAAAGLDPDTPDALARFLEIYDRRLLDTTRVYAGTEEMLGHASRRGRLAVLTNKPEAPSLRILEALGLLPFFDRVIGGDSEYGRKPDPAGLQAIGGGHVPVLLVGDSPIDWETARAADCVFAWARYGFGAARFEGSAPETPYVLNRPADLMSTLDRVAALATGA
jgi:phosphoglycolate phosphatase